MTVFDHREFDDHEQVVFCRDADAGLSAIIAVHSTVLGPACGGCRMWPYRTPDEALNDALRLSRAMSYKNAMAGLPLGGGKAVVMGDPAVDKRPDSATRVRTPCADARGALPHGGGCGHHPGRCAHHGRSLQLHVWLLGRPRALHRTRRLRRHARRCAIQIGARSMAGLKVAVQGIGNVGRHLCELLYAAGADLFVADIRPEAVAMRLNTLTPSRWTLPSSTRWRLTFLPPAPWAA